MPWPGCLGEPSVEVPGGRYRRCPLGLLLAVLLSFACGANAGAEPTPRELQPAAGKTESAASKTETATEKNILLLYAYGYGGRGVELFSDGFFRSVTALGFPVTHVFAEYLDIQRNSSTPGYRRELADALVKKYTQRRIDLIVTVQQPALSFLLERGQAIAPEAPVITIQNRQLAPEETGSRKIVGVLNHFDITGTLERALELFPATRHVLFVSGSSAADLKLAEEIRTRVAPWKNRLEIEDTAGQTLEQILDKAAHLPPYSVIVFAQYNVDSAGRVALAYEVEGMVTRVANAPVFGFYDFNLRNGGIGGSVIAVEESGADLGRLAVSLARGLPLAESGQSLQEQQSVPMFDWTQIRRWGGDVRRLPKNAVFLNRPPSAWEQYGDYIAAIAGFIVLESALIFALLANIRSRTQAEAALAHSERRFRQLFERAPVPMATVGKDGARIDVNARFVQSFGYAPEEVSTLDDWWPRAYPDPAYRRQVIETWSEAVVRARETGTDIEPIEYRVTCKSGAERIVVISGIALGDDLLVTLADITERKQAEADIRALNAGLERRVQERTAELTAANHELDSFAYAVSHDLRAPLRAVSGFSRALIEDIGVELAGDARPDLHQINLAVVRMTDLIEGLLSLSRCTRGDLAHDPVDISALAAEIRDELERGHPERRVDCRIEPGLIARGDARMVAIALRNLLDNAWKYTGGVAEAKIEIHALRRDGKLFVCISDNGAGFDPALAGNLFKPFRRLHRDDEFPGAGIGLATVQRIVHRHSGTIEATGAPGQGARFCFTLPEEAPPAQHPTPPQ